MPHLIYTSVEPSVGPPRQPQPFTAVFGSNSLHHVDDGDLTSSELMYDLYQSSYELQSDGHTLKSRRVACLKIQLCIHPQARSRLASMSPLARQNISGLSVLLASITAKWIIWRRMHVRFRRNSSSLSERESRDGERDRYRENVENKQSPDSNLPSRALL